MAMNGDSPRTPTQRLDYRPPDWWIDSVELTLVLDPERTLVRALLIVRRNTQASTADQPLMLHGSGLVTRRIALDGREIPAEDWIVGDEVLTIHDVPDRARIETEVEIAPAANTALEGLYRSGIRC
jgi:aminopeptidase N